MKTHNLLLLVSLTLITPALSQDKAQVTNLLKQLQNKDKCHSALFGLQNSLDPRIPDACLPVLQMKDADARNLAARIIGSRWRQIPQERVPVFVQALKPLLQDESLVNMARRGIALLSRDYSNAMVSPGKSKRWVIYERRSLPCLIDTKNNTEELLGPSPGSSSELMFPFGSAGNDEEVSDDTFWHPELDMVALDILEGRIDSTVWIWRHGKGLKKVTSEEIEKALGNPRLAAGMPFYTHIKGWNGANLDISIEYYLQKGDDSIARETMVRWNSATDNITVLAKKVAK